MLNRQALKTSLDSLVMLGSKDLDIDNVREYYILYTNTLEYIKSYMEPNGELNTYYDKFPKLQQYDIDTLQNVTKGYIKGFWNSIISSTRRWSLGGGYGRIYYPEDMNPAKVALFNAVNENIPVINMVASELIMILDRG